MESCDGSMALLVRCAVERGAVPARGRGESRDEAGESRASPMHGREQQLELSELLLGLPCHPSLFDSESWRAVGERERDLLLSLLDSTRSESTVDPLPGCRCSRIPSCPTSYRNPSSAASSRAATASTCSPSSNPNPVRRLPLLRTMRTTRLATTSSRSSPSSPSQERK